MKNKSLKPLKNIGLKVGGVPEHFNYPWRIAIEEGLFRKEGIALHWADMSGGTGQMIKGLQTGSLDVAVLLTEGITKSILQGLDAKILQIYVRSPLCWGIHVPYKSRCIDSNELKNRSFAISREGSGSHLMAYILGDNHGWDLKKIQFNVVGDLYGGLWAMENLEAQGFLWEKYTTQPFVDQKKCRRIGEVVTPWPSFVIAARNEVLEKHPKAIATMLKIIQNRAALVESNDNTAEIISWRYNLDLYQVKNWISETEWNKNNKDMEKTIEKVVSYLAKLKLLSDSETENWVKKLFI